MGDPVVRRALLRGRHRADQGIALLADMPFHRRAQERGGLVRHQAYADGGGGAGRYGVARLRADAA